MSLCCPRDVPAVDTSFLFFMLPLSEGGHSERHCVSPSGIVLWQWRWHRHDKAHVHTLAVDNFDSWLRSKKELGTCFLKELKWKLMFIKCHPWALGDYALTLSILTTALQRRHSYPHCLVRHLSLTETYRLAYNHTARMWQGWDSDQRWAKGCPPAMAAIPDLVISCSLLSTWGLLRD